MNAMITPPGKKRQERSLNEVSIRRRPRIDYRLRGYLTVACPRRDVAGSIRTGFADKARS